VRQSSYSINSNSKITISADAAPLHPQKSVHRWHLPDDFPCVVDTVGPMRGFEAHDLSQCFVKHGPSQRSIIMTGAAADNWKLGGDFSRILKSSNSEACRVASEVLNF
jgi:hypothetical protein